MPLILPQLERHLCRRRTTCCPSKLKARSERNWYLGHAAQLNWSRNMLVMPIETRAHQRAGHAVTNFSRQLPAPLPDLAGESLKDPYRLDFLGLSDAAQRREIETALVQHIPRFLVDFAVKPDRVVEAWLLVYRAPKHSRGSRANGTLSGSRMFMSSART